MVTVQYSTVGYSTVQYSILIQYSVSSVIIQFTVNNVVSTHYGAHRVTPMGLDYDMTLY